MLRIRALRAEIGRRGRGQSPVLLMFLLKCTADALSYL